MGPPDWRYIRGGFVSFGGVQAGAVWSSALVSAFYLAAYVPLGWHPGLVGLCFVTPVCLDVLWAFELACLPLFALFLSS